MMVCFICREKLDENHTEYDCLRNISISQKYHSFAGIRKRPDYSVGSGLKTCKWCILPRPKHYPGGCVFNIQSVQYSPCLYCAHRNHQTDWCRQPDIFTSPDEISAAVGEFNQELEKKASIMFAEIIMAKSPQETNAYPYTSTMENLGRSRIRMEIN